MYFIYIGINIEIYLFSTLAYLLRSFIFLNYIYFLLFYVTRYICVYICVLFLSPFDVTMLTRCLFWLCILPVTVQVKLS